MFKKIIVATIGVAIAGAGLFAQWSSDPAVNTVISDTTGTQVLPKIVVKGNGESFISWFSEMVGWQFDVYLQRLDADGNKLWAKEGICVSNKPTETWVSDYGIAFDSDGNVVLVNHDYRSGFGDVYAWRISPEGQFLWGNDGIQLTNDTAANYSPNLIPLKQGDEVFVWNIVPPDTIEKIRVGLQRLSKNGQPQWGSDLIISDTMNNYEPAILRTEDDNFIVAWNRAASFDTTDTLLGQQNVLHIFAQKFDANGTPLWAENVQIDTGKFLPVISPIRPYLTNDGENGAFIIWEAAMPFTVTTFVQHIDANGNLQYPPNGVEVSTLNENTHDDPAFCFFPATQELFVFWSEYHYDGVNLKDNWGLSGQKFSYAGERLWGDSGKVFEPLIPDTVFFDIVAKPGPENDIGVFYVELCSPTGQPSHVKAMRIDSDGKYFWEDEKIVLSSVPSDKYNLAASDFAHNQWIAVWADDRNSPPGQEEFGIYAQNISIDGSLGPVGIEEAPLDTPFENLLVNSPNRATKRLAINYTVSVRSPVVLAVYDLSGALVQTLVTEVKNPGSYTVNWNAQVFPAGVYFVRLAAGDISSTKKLVLMR